MTDNIHKPENYSRRAIIKKAASIGAFGALGIKASARENTPAPLKLKKGAVIIFQGDSITDEGRKKDIVEPNDSKGLGRGYPAMAAGLLHAKYPEHELKVYNRGISGNKVPDLAARWQKDVIDLKPDVLSIKIGINDYWHTIAFGSKYKGTVEDYEKGYDELIQRTLKELPDVRLIICDPFTFRDWPEYQPYRVAAKKLADKHNLTFVPYQEKFDPLRNAVSEQFWLWDGVHPTTAGHTMMAKIWCDTVGI